MQGLILYHDPGAGGDFLTMLLQDTGKFYGMHEYDGFDETGKVILKPDKPEFIKLFPPNPNPLLEREWTNWDEVKMKSITDKIWVITAKTLRNIKTLRNKGCDWPIFRITYDKNMWWFIKKCVLKKLMRKPFWPTPNPVDEYMLQKGKLAPWMLKKHLKNPKQVGLLCKRTKEKVWKKDPPKWEITVDNLLANDFSPLAKEFSPNMFDQKIIDDWTSKQEPMFVKRPILPLEIEKLFGYNKLLEPVNYACPLDEFDNIVIKFYYPDAPTFNNTQELFTYF